MPVRWWFHAKTRTADGRVTLIKLFKLSKVKIRRHLKIKAAATPYDSAYTAYFSQLKPDLILFKAGSRKWL